VNGSSSAVKVATSASIGAWCLTRCRWQAWCSMPGVRKTRLPPARSSRAHRSRSSRCATCRATYAAKNLRFAGTRLVLVLESCAPAARGEPHNEGESGGHAAAPGGRDCTRDCTRSSRGRWGGQGTVTTPCP